MEGVYRPCCTLSVSHTLVSTLMFEHDDGWGGSEWEKMGHKHVGWHGNIAMGLQEIARRGRFEGVNTRISGKSSGLRAVQLAWGVDFVKTLRV